MSEQIEKNQNTSIDTTDGETARKLFVGGLSWQTTEDGLQRYLEGLGIQVERVLIMRDKVSGRSRGFGFVILKHQDMLDKAVNGTLQLDGRKIEAKRAIPKRDMEKSGRKVFVGGIPISLTAADFRKFFENFGPVTDAQVMTERESGRSRGFGFVTFGDDETLEKVLGQQHSIQGKPVEVKRAEPKKVEKQQRPIILPVPYFSPPGYPYQVAYPSGSGTTHFYGQALTYDPASGQYYLASPMYTPQFIPVEESGAPYNEFFYDNPVATPAPASPASTPTSPDAGSTNTITPSSHTKRARRDVVTGPKGDWSNSHVEVSSSSTGSSSLVDRVRLQKDERRKRGVSNPEPERVGRKLSTAVPQTGSTGLQRKSVVTMATAGNWRSRVNAGSSQATASTASTTNTISPTSTNSTKEGGSLHKYFQ